MRKTALAVALLVVAGGVRAAAEDPQPGENFDGWGQALGGLRIALSAPPQPIGGSPLLRALLAKLRNEGPAAVTEKQLGRYPAIRVEPDAPLPAGLALLPTIDGVAAHEGELAKDAVVTWMPRVLRLSEDAPTSVRLRLRLTAFGAQNEPLMLRSEVLELDLSDRPAARTLTDEDLAAGWTGGSVLVHRDLGGLWGTTHTEVWPDGTVRVHRTAGGKRGETTPRAGFHTGRLTSAEQQELAEVLRAAKPWRLAEIPRRMLIPDESTVGLAVISGEAALLAQVPLEDAVKLEGFPELRRHLDALALRISKGE